MIMTTVSLHPNGETARIHISWNNIEDRYITRFRIQFQGKRKIHFDTLPEELRTVDGAKAKWVLLVLLDALIYFLENDSPIESARRYFHQQRELIAAISTEISLAEHEIHRIMGGSRVRGGAVEVSIDALPSPWHCLDAFREHHRKATPTKAKNKFLTILDRLTGHSALRAEGFDMLSAVNKMLSKVLACDVHDDAFEHARSLSVTLGTTSSSLSTSSASPKSVCRSFHTCSDSPRYHVMDKALQKARSTHSMRTAPAYPTELEAVGMMREPLDIASCVYASVHRYSRHDMMTSHVMSTSDEHADYRPLKRARRPAAHASQWSDSLDEDDLLLAALRESPSSSPAAEGEADADADFAWDVFAEELGCLHSLCDDSRCDSRASSYSASPLPSSRACDCL